MPRVSHASVIDAPMPDIWAALNDISHTPDWVVGLERAELTTPEAYGVGSVYIDYNRLGPFLQKTPWCVTEFEPYIHQVHVSASSVIPTTMTLNLSQTPGGTRIEMIVDFEFLPRLGALGRLLGRTLMRRMIASVIAQNQANLGKHLGQRTPVATDTFVAVHA